MSLASIKEAEFTEVEAQLKADISEAKEKSKRELEVRESEFKIKIVQLEAEIHFCLLSGLGWWVGAMGCGRGCVGEGGMGTHDRV